MRRHMSNAHTLPLSIGAMRCANGETWEFWLEVDDQRIDESTRFVTVPEGQGITRIAAKILPGMLDHLRTSVAREP